VAIKVLKSDVIKELQKETKLNKREYFELDFKVIEDTTFEEMRDEVCDYWGLKDEKDEFTLVLPN